MRVINMQNRGRMGPVKLFLLKGHTRLQFECTHCTLSYERDSLSLLRILNLSKVMRSRG